MTQIMWETTAAKKTNEIDNEQVLVWTKRVEVQRTLKVLVEAKKYSKKFDAMKGMNIKQSTVN